MTSLLEQQVTQLAALRRELHALEAREQKLTAAVRAQMREHGQDVIRAGPIQAKLSEVERLSVPPKKLHSLLEEKDFLRCVSVKVTDARRYVGEAALRRIAKIERSFQLRLTDRAPAGADTPRPATHASVPHASVPHADVPHTDAA